jgi:hypothetical protein
MSRVTRLRSKNPITDRIQSTVPQSLIFRHIQDDDVTSKFSLGDASKVALKIFLRKEAPELHHKEIAKTYVVVEDDEWDVPVHDDRLLLGFLIPEGAQAGMV